MGGQNQENWGRVIFFGISLPYFSLDIMVFMGYLVINN